jgi:CRP/FNR family transcriptional regulator, cyclic AMP receptor protein
MRIGTTFGRTKETMKRTTIKQFQGPEGRLRLIDALKAQHLIVDESLATEIVRLVKLEEISAGTNLIKHGAFDTDLFFILNGEFSVTIGGCVVARRKAGEQVGEMAVVDPHIPRSASVTAICDSVVARITEADFSALAERFPRLWRRIALELVTLLRNGNTADRDRGLLQPMKY